MKYTAADITAMTEALRKVAQAIAQASSLSTQLDYEHNDDLLNRPESTQAYPFLRSFDELADEVEAWADSISKIRE